MYDVFLEPGTQVRELHISQWLGPLYSGEPSNEEDCFANRGKIETLDTLVCFGKMESTSLFRFLRSNTQLSKLMFDYDPSNESISQLLELLQSFSKLESLSLTWDGDSILEAAFEAVGKLHGLRQLSLSASHRFGCRYTGAFDHSPVRKHLRGLQNLQKLAFNHVSHGSPGDENDKVAMEDYYYMGEVPPPQLTVEESPTRSTILSQPLDTFPGDGDEERDMSRREAAFHAIHAPRMLQHARDYGNFFPQLQWLYLGKHVMGYRRASGQDREAYFLTEKRDDCFTALMQIFGTSVSAGYT